MKQKIRKGNNLSIDEWKRCLECKDLIGKHSIMGEDKVRCKHCYNKLKYGVSDMNNCFKGSVIRLD